VKRLNCRICGRQEVWGILSSAAWGQTNDGDGRVCPNCMTEHTDWRERAEPEPPTG
jgi:hypothetical protein